MRATKKIKSKENLNWIRKSTSVFVKIPENLRE